VPMMTWGSLDASGNIVRDPTFPDFPTFKEVCEKTDGCETKGEAWDAWKAFFVAGFPSQKIAFLPAGTSQDVIDTFVDAFAKVKAHPDFPTIAAKRVGKYPMYVGVEAQKALGVATTVPAEAKAYVINWLKDAYGVELK